MEKNNDKLTTISTARWLKVLDAIKKEDSSNNVIEILIDIHNKENEKATPKKSSDMKLEGYVTVRWSGVRQLISNIDAYKTSNHFFSMEEASEEYLKEIFFRRIADEAIRQFDMDTNMNPCSLCCEKVEQTQILNLKPYPKFFLKKELAQAAKFLLRK